MLTENEKQYRTIFKYNPQPVWIYDRNTLQFIDVNDAAINHYGYSHEEFMRMTIMDVRNDEQKKKLQEHLINISEKEKSAHYRGDWKHIKKDGTEIDVEITRTQINLNGKEANLALIKDVTEIRKAEKAIRDSEEKMNNFMNSANDVFALYDENFYLLMTNDAGMKMINETDKRKVVGKHISEIFPNIKNTRRFNQYQEVLRTGKTIRTEDFRADYADREIYLVITAFKVGNGLGIIASDITERRKIQEQVEGSEKNYRQLVELSPDGILILQAGIVVYANSTALELFGLKNHSEITTTFDIMLPEYYENTKEQMAKAMNGENVPFSEIKIRKSNGLILEVESKPSAIIYQGEPAMQVVIHDLTQIKLLAKERARAVIAEETTRQLQRDVNERLRMEKQLLESQKFSRKLIDSSLDMICASDTEGNVIEFNEAAQKAFGYRREEIIGKQVQMLYDDVNEHLRINRLLGEGNGTFSGEITNQRKNGEIFTSYLSCSVLKDDKDIPFGFMGVSRDITEHKKTELALKKSEEEFRSLAENAPVLILKIDKTGKILYVNRAETVNKEELYATKTVFDFIHPSEFKNYQRYIKQVFETGEPINFEVQGIRQNNTMGWYSTRLAPIKVREVFDSLILVTTDITESKIAEEKLRHSEERYRDLFENATDLIQSVDAAGKIVYVNKAWKQTLEYTDEDLKNKIIFDFIHPDCIKHCSQLFERIVKGEKMENIELEYITKRGRKIIASGNASAKFENGKMVSTRGIFHDITENKYAEVLIKKSLREKEVLLKEIHHRVKNNMQVISSILNLQSAYVKDSKTLDVLKESQNRIKAMAYIHESLYQASDFSKIDFSEYIVTLADNLAYSYRTEEKNILLEIDSGKNIFLSIDMAIPCGLIINELISNSYKHAFPQRAKGLVNLKLNKKGKTIQIKLSDNGIGIPPGIDFQNTETLGLQLVSTLVQQVNGKMKIDNKNGTRFIIEFKEK